MRHKVYLSSTDPEVSALKQTLASGLEYSGINLPVGRPIIVKPNMTWTSWKPGVTSTPDLLKALAELFVDHGDRLTFVEGDGGMNSWKAEEALYSHGCFDIAKRHAGKVNVRSLMHEPTRVETVEVLGTKVEIPLPESLLDQDKFFVTVPTLKTHCLAGISLNFKNQWGCIPDAKRLCHHHMLAPAAIAINRLIGVDLSIIDALTALDGNGPMYGDEIPFGALIIGCHQGAVARVASRVMQIDHRKSPILKLADRLGMIPRDDAIDTSNPIDDFLKHEFKTVILPINRISIGLSKSKWATHAVYNSHLTPVIYGIRKKLFGWKGIPRNAVPEWIYGQGERSKPDEPKEVDE